MLAPIRSTVWPSTVVRQPGQLLRQLAVADVDVDARRPLGEDADAAAVGPGDQLLDLASVCVSASAGQFRVFRPFAAARDRDDPVSVPEQANRAGLELTRPAHDRDPR